MSDDDTRDRAARALLQLIGKGPGDCFPFPEAAYRDAIAVVDALTEHLTERPVINADLREAANDGERGEARQHLQAQR